MVSNHWCRWLPFALLVGCSGKLNVGDTHGTAGAGSNAGAGGGGQVTAGAAGSAGEIFIDPTAGSAGLDHSVAGFDSGGAAGSGGAPVQPPGPGSLGQACLKTSSAIEADGTVAKATVTTPIHCDYGLTCNASNRCEVIGNCPNAMGPCIVHRPALAAGDAGGAAGTGGAGGAAGADNEFSAGAGGVGTVYTGLGTVRSAVGVMAMTADDTHLYWVEYGTRDSLGNYQNDGALMAYSLADGKLATLGADLKGPRTLGVTSAHAYVSVDGAGIVGTETKNQVLRLPLAGGAAAIVASDDFGTRFAATGETIFWSDRIKWQTATGTAAPTALIESIFDSDGTADATHLYYETSAGISRIPVAGGTAQSLVAPNYPFALTADTLYGIEQVDGPGCVLSKVAKAGGTWLRSRALGAGWVRGLQIVGDRVFLATSDDTSDFGRIRFSTALLTSNDPPVRIGEIYQRGKRPEVTFAATAQAFFWSDGRAIYQRKLSDLP